MKRQYYDAMKLHTMLPELNTEPSKIGVYHFKIEHVSERKTERASATGRQY